METEFPFGAQSGSSCSGDIKCDWCGTLHNEGYPNGGGQDVHNIDFGSLQVCECCFEKLEKSVAAWMDMILPWYRRILDQRLSSVLARQEQLQAFTHGPEGDTGRLDALEREWRQHLGAGPAHNASVMVYKGEKIREVIDRLLPAPDPSANAARIISLKQDRRALSIKLNAVENELARLQSCPPTPPS